MLSHVTSNAFVYILRSFASTNLTSPTFHSSPHSTHLQLPSNQHRKFNTNHCQSSEHNHLQSWRSAAPPACAVLAPNPLPVPRSVCPGNAPHESYTRRHCICAGSQLTWYDWNRPRSLLLSPTSDTDLHPSKNATRLPAMTTLPSEPQSPRRVPREPPTRLRIKRWRMPRPRLPARPFVHLSRKCTRARSNRARPNGSTRG